MPALIATVSALMFFVFSCGQPAHHETAGLLAASGKGRLTCAAFSDPTGSLEKISGCTEGGTMTAQSPNYSMRVVKNGNDLAIDLRNHKNGQTWSGIATLKFPIGGTGTRARAFVNQPIFAMMACELDTLLSCP